MTARDLGRLVGVHTDLAKILVRVFDEMDAEKAPMFIVQGVRTQAQQVALYAQGRTMPGRIVTMKDGIVHPSDHQPHRDGKGYAVDCAFIGPQPFDERHPWELYGESCEAHGLIWGGRWEHPHDSPHVELRDVKPEQEMRHA